MSHVSIIITTHSRPTLLARSVESARQAGADEIVVVDDASSDETSAVCRELSGIRCIRAERNQGVAGARNIGILASTGDYLGFLDDDDLRLPGSVRLQSTLLDERPEVGMVYGQALVGDADCRPLDLPPRPLECPQGDLFRTLLCRNLIYCQTVLFRRECLLRVGMLDASIAGVDDSDLWVRIAEHYPIAALAEPVAIWRQATPASGQGSSRLADLIRCAARTHDRKWLRLPRAARDPALCREARRTYRAALSDLLLCAAAEAAPAGHPGYVCRCVAAGIALSPARAVRPRVLGTLLRALLPTSAPVLTARRPAGTVVECGGLSPD